MSENPANLTSMAIENPPPVAPQLSAQEQSVLYGAVREKIANNAMGAGALFGAVGGGLIGGLWSLATKGNHWGRKTFGVAAAGAALGAITSRLTWGRDMGDKATTQIDQQISQLPAEQRPMAYQQIAQAVGLNTPQTAVHAASAEYQGPQQANAVQLG